MKFPLVILKNVCDEIQKEISKTCLYDCCNNEITIFIADDIVIEYKFSYKTFEEYCTDKMFIECLKSTILVHYISNH